MDQPVTIPSLPFPLRWAVPPERWHAGDGGSLSVHAGPRTDLFVSPQGAEPNLSAPRLLGRPGGEEFQLSARVTVDFAATYDAGVLLLYADDGAWAKLCFERSPQGEPLVVSVVTRGLSDDANAFAVAGRTVWLRVSRVAPGWAFHASVDGAGWRFVRHFALEPSAGMSVGFLAQSPTGEGCTAEFDEIGYRVERLADLRSGV
jgi:regulation of enolase protein 1 (concanavalin A-like superfamily)